MLGLMLQVLYGDIDEAICHHAVLQNNCLAILMVVSLMLGLMLQVLYGDIDEAICHHAYYYAI